MIAVIYFHKIPLIHIEQSFAINVFAAIVYSMHSTSILNVAKVNRIIMAWAHVKIFIDGTPFGS